MFLVFCTNWLLKSRKPLCGKGLEALVGLKWDGHELFSFDIVGNSKWDIIMFLQFVSLKGDRGKDVRNGLECIVESPIGTRLRYHIVIA